MTGNTQTILGHILTGKIDAHRCAAARAIGKLALPGAVEALIQALLDEDPDVRADAAQALRDLGDPAAIPALTENLMGDPEPDVKKPALAALIALRAPGIVSLLRDLAVSRTDKIAWDDDEFYLDGWDSWVDLQLMAIEGLGELRASEGVGDILIALGDEMGQDVTPVAIPALARMDREGAEALEHLYTLGDAQLRRRIARAVVAADNPHCAALTDTFLASDNAQVREIALAALPAGDERLTALFGDKDAGVRAAVVAHSGAALADLTAPLAQDDDALVRAAVFRVVAANPAEFADADFAKTVQKAISGDPEAAIQAALALLALKGRKSIKGMIHAITNPRLPLAYRVGVIEVLKQAGPTSVPFLLRAAGDEERQMRLTALTALVDFAANDPVWPNPAGDGLLAALRGELVLPADEIDLDKAGAEEVATDIDPDAETADASAEPVPVESLVMRDVLAMPANPSTTKTDEDKGVPDGDEAALKTSTLDSILAPAPMPEWQDPIEPEEMDLDDNTLRLLDLAERNRMAKRKVSLQTSIAPHLDVRRYGASLLGGVANAEVADALIKVLDEDDEDLCEAALDSLVQIAEVTGALSEAVLPVLQRLLNGSVSKTRVLALRAISHIDDERAILLLTECLSDTDPQVRVEAVRGRATRGLIDDLTEACLHDDYPGTAITAARALAAAKGVEAIEPLIAFACRVDGTYRDEIGRLLGAHAGQAAIERLLELMQDDTHLRKRLVLIDALAAAHIAHTELPEPIAA